jgi:hypothetical protein
MLGATAARAAGTQPERLGDAHQVVIDQSFAASAAHYSWRGDGNELMSANDLRLAPSLTYFPISGLSVGLRASVGYGTSTSFGQTRRTLDLGVTPSVGYVAPLSDHFYLWPKLGVTFERLHLFGSNLLDPFQSEKSIKPQVEALVAWSPAEHFFVAAGPLASISYNSNGASHYSMANLGIATTIGGYFSP